MNAYAICTKFYIPNKSMRRWSHFSIVDYNLWSMVWVQYSRSPYYFHEFKAIHWNVRKYQESLKFEGIEFVYDPMPMPCIHDNNQIYNGKVERGGYAWDVVKDTISSIGASVLNYYSAETIFPLKHFLIYIWQPWALFQCLHSFIEFVIMIISVTVLT